MKRSNKEGILKGEEGEKGGKETVGYRGKETGKGDTNVDIGFAVKRQSLRSQKLEYFLPETVGKETVGKETVGKETGGKETAETKETVGKETTETKETVGKETADTKETAGKETAETKGTVEIKETRDTKETVVYLMCICL
ncbi:hypothetical protein EBH_0050520 [Eimeria brunetti]|uniref:Uncharacterized protein n=1 Tax=Eimeria brunetti TaxID=51314 RepID=U6LQX5_9EIME|nr:hypothetical protein EBH_0050520 [Eimeria brunetti]